VSGTAKHERPDPSGLTEPVLYRNVFYGGLVCLDEVIFNKYGLSVLIKAYKAILMALFPTDPIDPNFCTDSNP